MFCVLKEFIDRFKTFLAEEKRGGKKLQIFCDMDGVLVDFEGGIIDKINQDIKNEEIQVASMVKLRAVLEKQGRDSITIDDLGYDKERRIKVARDYMYASVGDSTEWWADLPWTTQGKELWRLITDPAGIGGFMRDGGVHILTAPMKKGSEMGKIKWIEKNLSPAPVQIHQSHNKFDWASSEKGGISEDMFKQGYRNILIDDFFVKNIKPWQGRGGLGAHHEDGNLAETKKRLEELIKEWGG